MADIKPVLVFACGNPSRGDDALGPKLLQQLEKKLQAEQCDQQVELLSDYQLQIEHATDLVGREKILFVDASISVDGPCSLEQISPQRDTSFTTHAMSAAAVMAVYQQIYTEPLPDCFQLAIRGYEFELGADLTEEASLNLTKSLLATLNWIEESS